MVKKKFIEKRSSVTYNLVFRNTDDVDELPQRLLVDAEKGVGVGRVDPAVAEATAAAIAASGRRYAPGHPLAWMEEEEATTGPMSDERRRELIELGFPGGWMLWETWLDMGVASGFCLPLACWSCVWGCVLCCDGWQREQRCRCCL
jgi:hypothetical protein